MAKKSTAKKVDSAALKGITGQCAKAVAQMAADGRKVHVVGRIRNGKVEIDQSNLQAFARKFPNANMSFIAVNAPFDPVPYSGN
jgi:hypothetical protein